jgi:hypothetical protein
VFGTTTGLPYVMLAPKAVLIAIANARQLVEDLTQRALMGGGRTRIE